MRKFLYFALFLLISSQFCLPQQPLPFKKGEISVVGTISTKIVTDLDNDGFKDLVIVHRGLEKHIQHYLTVYFYTNERFEKAFSSPLNKISVFDIADINGDGIQDFIHTWKREIYVRYIKRSKKTGDTSLGKALKILHAENLFSYPIMRSIVHIDFAGDYDGDGVTDFLLPVSTGYKFYKGSERTYLKARTLKVEMGAVFPRFQRKTDLIQNNSQFFNVMLPAIVQKDFDSNGEQDIIFLGHSMVKIYLVRKKVLNTIPITIKFAQNSLSDSVMTGPAAMLRDMTDINRDGYLDVVTQRVSFKREGMSVNTHLDLYFGTNTSRFNAEPDMSIHQEGMFAIFPPEFGDYNSDGLADILTFKIDFSIGKMISTFISKAASGSLKIYHQKPDRSFADSGEKRKLKVSMQMRDPFVTSILNFRGDFNGDGSNDLALGDLTENELEVYYGKPGEIYSRDYDFMIKGKLYINNQVMDVNGNGRDDVVMTDPVMGRVSYIIF